MIENIVQETLKELKKAKKEPYPLYYRNTFNNIVKEKGLEIDQRLLLEETINERLLNSTKKTTNFILKQNKEIEDESKAMVKAIEVKDTKEEVIESVKEFENRLVNKLEEYQNKIRELNKELETAYKELHIDSLTKAFNRKALEVTLDKIFEMEKKKKFNFFIMILDLDHFKEINDTYGHLVGDYVLISFVRTIKKVIRETDKIYRYGGDEFIIIFNRIEKSVMRKIADKILTKISSTKLKYKDELISLTTSIGVTCYKDGDTKETLLKRADEALYKSKKTRNRVTIEC